MPYTSTAGLALAPGANDELKRQAAALPPTRRRRIQELIRYADAHKTKRGAHVYFWNSVPWTEDDEEYCFLRSFLSSLPAADYHFCRVGDDVCDNEEDGTFQDPFDLRMRREVTLGLE